MLSVTLAVILAIVTVASFVGMLVASATAMDLAERCERLEAQLELKNKRRTRAGNPEDRPVVLWRVK
jgi:hypothetical protein